MAISLNFSLKMVFSAFQMTTAIWEYQCKQRKRNSEGAYILSVNISLLRKLRITKFHKALACSAVNAAFLWLVFIDSPSWLPSYLRSLQDDWHFVGCKPFPFFYRSHYINWKLTRISRCVLVSPLQFYSLVFFFSSFVFAHLYYPLMYGMYLIVCWCVCICWRS